MKVVIPVAGVGSRLKPHTFTIPKPLMDVAGKPILDYIVDDVKKLNPDEVVFVVGYMKKNVQEYVEKTFPDLNCSFVYQKERDGNGSAIRLALDKFDEDDDLFIVFGDTMVDFDYKSILSKRKNTECLVLAMEVDEPSHYGIMNVDEKYEVLEVEEKPKEPKSNLAIIGVYYFKSLMDVKKQLNDFYEKGIKINGEYNIIQPIEAYIKSKTQSVKAVPVKKWFDCGRPSVLLEANQYFLRKVSKGESKKRGTSIIIPPAYVAKTATIENSVIGPYASVGEGVVIKDSYVKNSIISSLARVENIVLKDSLIGKEAIVNGKPSRVNVGEKSEITLN